MKKLNFIAFSLISSSCLFSCAQKPIDFNEAIILIDSIQNKLDETSFEFPTKITINKLVKKNDSYIDKLSIRFSLDDQYFYYSNGYGNSTIVEHWFYVDETENVILNLKSVTSEEKSVKTYYTIPFNENKDFFTLRYEKIKESLKSECLIFKDTLSTCEELSSETDTLESLKITSSNEKNIELNATINKSNNKVKAQLQFSDYLPRISNVYRFSENKEEKNFETKYEYNGINVTRPNIHNFIESNKKS